MSVGEMRRGPQLLSRADYETGGRGKSIPGAWVALLSPLVTDFLCACVMLPFARFDLYRNIGYTFFCRADLRSTNENAPVRERTPLLYRVLHGKIAPGGVTFFVFRIFK